MRFSVISLCPFNDSWVFQSNAHSLCSVLHVSNEILKRKWGKGESEVLETKWILILGGVITCAYCGMPQVQANIYFTLMTIWIFYNAVFYFWKVFEGQGCGVYVLREKTTKDTLEFLTNNKARIFHKEPNLSIHVEDNVVVVVTAYF